MTLQEVLAARSEGERKLRSAINALEAKTCADILADACTPRPPKPEWFGFGPGQWDSWWCAYEEGGAAAIFDRVWCDGEVIRFPDGYEVWIGSIVSCVPVARKGYPAPVGWQVLEVSK